MKTVLLSAACLVLVMLGGCGPRLSDQRDLTIDVGDIISIPIDPISSDQTIKVMAKSQGKPINVHVFLKEHEEAIERKITLGKPPENILASEEDSENISLEASVPAGKEVVVRLQTSGPHKADVHLEITN